MNANVNQIEEQIKRGFRFIGFTYTKENGEVSRRVVGFGAHIAAAQERRGTPVNGAGNWHKGQTTGEKSFAILRDGEWYVRGYDTRDNKLKIFKAAGISNLVGVNQI